MIGKTISHYQIIEEIGAGGMGVVYKAEDTKLKRTVAIKFLPPSLIQDSKAKTRFFKEAQAASGLDHPNICTVHEIDETDSGHLFMVMSFCKGAPLSNYIRQKTLGIEEILDIGLQIGSALSSAHESKIIHRDIKSDNIILTDQNKAKIIDFGLAKLSDQTKTTKDGTIAGTVAYMSPEQTQGKKVDHRTDIWSFGVVLYEMITGQLPFMAEYDQALLYSIVNDQPERMTNLRPEVPHQLEEIVTKSIAKSPGDRYQNFNDLVIDLQKLKSEIEKNRSLHKVSRKLKNEQRRLAAIMFTDMVGYSAITQKNESLALELLEEHREILRSHFPRHSGNEVETIGDAFFVEFNSALEAVECAIEIQKSLFERNKSVPEAKQIRIRIGVHLGDVVHSGQNVLGDGVNIAARIEPLAHSCGICVSQDVARQIQNKIELPIIQIDRAKLKNIQLPVEVFAVVLPWLEKELRTKKITRLKRKNVWIPAASIILVLVLIAIGFMPPSDIGENKKSIAVLPFRNMSEKIENEYFSDGITEDIIAHLSKLKNLKVVSRTSIMQYKNTEKSLTEIGDELNVSAILEGSVRRDNQRLKIVAQLIDADADEHLWTETYDEQMTEIFDIQTAVAEKIATSLKTKISSRDQQLFDKQVTKNILAYDLYLKGRYHWNKRMPDDLKKGIDYFEKALKIDPKFAHAFSGLADSYAILGNFGILPPNEAFTKAKKAAYSALEINDILAEAHTSLALAQMHYDWKWEEAEAGFKKAIQLDPSYAMAYSLYASLLTSLKRSDEAKLYRDKASELDPVCPAILLNESLELYFEKEYDQTIIHCTNLLELDPFLILAYIPLSGAYAEKSMYEVAIERLINAQFLSKGHPTIMAITGYIHAVSGKKEEAADLLEILLEKSQEEYIGPFWIAVLYTGLGDSDNTFTWLEKAFEQKDGVLVYLNVIPIFDDLRSDPRFISLLSRMGLPG
jgi:serine/threonine protein kinase/TolB-like protein